MVRTLLDEPEAAPDSYSLEWDGRGLGAHGRVVTRDPADCEPEDEADCEEWVEATCS